MKLGTFKAIGLYIHVPFCLSKCPYCDFYSVPAEPELIERYTISLCTMLREVSAVRKLAADTLYFGGGTPSLLGEKNFERILQTVSDCFGGLPGEITLEANPRAAQLTLLKALRRLGIDRLSMGLQSANDAELCALGRSHTAGEARRAVLDAREAGFENISLDLMLAVPGQTQETLTRSIAFCASLGVEHLSAYLLKVEPGTPFGRQHMERRCPGEDEQADLYLCAVQTLAQQGYRQYEISNFCRPGFESRHNLKYWNAEDYLGLGPGAHSFLDGVRFSMPRNLQDFLRAVSANALWKKTGTGGDFEEYAMLRLRLTDGLVRRQVEERFRRNFDELVQRAQPLVESGLATADAERIALTSRGFLVSNQAIAYLIL